MTDTVTARQAETLLGVSRATISRMARDGRLNPERSEPFYLFDRSEVEQLSERRSA